MVATPVGTSAASALDLSDIQAIAVTGWKRLHHVCYLFVTFTGEVETPTAVDVRRRRDWLGGVVGQVAHAGQISISREADDATVRAGGPPRLQLGVTGDGLRALGAVDELAGLAQECKDGMASRARFLGDGDATTWELGRPGARPHVLLACFAADQPELDELVEDQLRRVEAAGATVTREYTHWIGAREHFGYADGISQPLIAGSRPDLPSDPFHDVPPGEILLGYENAYGKIPRGPRGRRADGTALDLGRNGTYLVFRKLQQHVEKFWHYFDQQARELMRAGVGPSVDCSADELDAWVDWLAAKSIGRWRSGAPLVKAPDHEDPGKAAKSVVNKFAFRDDDLAGTACPIGSHIRRANPRDAREPATSSADESRMVVRRHRVLRRGRSWGPPMDRLVARTGVPDGNRRGLLFVCLQASIARGFEFVQQTWLSNLGFGGLSREGDPLAKGEVDPRGTAHDGFTIPMDPIRIRLHGMPRFVSTLGGDYFFVPSISALQYFAQ